MGRTVKSLINTRAGNAHSQLFSSTTNKNNCQSASMSFSSENCIFCCNSIQQSSAKEFEFQSSLRQIFRYLQVNLAEIQGSRGSSPVASSSILRKDDNGSTDSGETCSNFPAGICEECGLVATKLSSYCAKLEETQMWITHFLRKLAEILSNSSHSSNFVDMEDTSLAALLRAQTKEKCIAKLEDKECPPRRLTTNSKLVKSVSASHLPQDPLNSSIPVVEIEENLECSSVRLEKDTKSTTSCPFCDKSLLTSKGLHLHTANTHPEQLLSSVKLKHVSDLRFKILCKQLLKSKGEGTVSNVNGKLICLYCPKKFSAEKFLKSHLIDSHLHVVKRKLKQLQKKGGKIVPASSKASGQNTLNHVKKLNLKQNDDCRDSLCPCPFCPRKFKGRYNLKMHIVTIHSSSLTMKPALKMVLNSAGVPIPRDQPMKIPKWCEECGKMVSKWSSHQTLHFRLQRELKSSKTSKLSQVSKDIETIDLETDSSEGSPSSFNNADDDSPSNGQTLSLPTSQKNPRDISWECLECGKSFSTPDELDTHRDSCCKEKDDEANNEEIVKNNRRDDGILRPFKCHACGTTYAHKASLTRHQKDCDYVHSNSSSDIPVILRTTTLFACFHCGKHFTRSRNRNRHMQTCSAHTISQSPWNPSVNNESDSGVHAAFTVVQNVQEVSEPIAEQTSQTQYIVVTEEYDQIIIKEEVNDGNDDIMIIDDPLHRV